MAPFACLRCCFSLAQFKSHPFVKHVIGIYGFQFMNDAKVFVFTRIPQLPIANALEYFFAH